MAANGNLLQGEVNEDPAVQEKDVARLIQGMVQALAAERASELQSFAGEE